MKIITNSVRFSKENPFSFFEKGKGFFLSNRWTTVVHNCLHEALKVNKEEYHEN